jgi:hypothetical protein
MSRMPDPTDTPPSAKPPSSVGDPRASRRRLLQGGLAAAPVLMTLVSRPVLARQCTSPSGFVSANASTAGRGVDCMGHTPEYWANPMHFSDWPSGYNAAPPGQVSRFNAYFNPNINPGNPTLVAVLQGNAGTDNAAMDNVAKYLVAALLNAGPPVLSPVLLGPAIRDIWSEFATTGFFTPTAGARWDANEIVEYLSTTMQ